MAFWNGTALVGAITTTTTTTTYATTSDKRLKENVNDVTDSGRTIDAMSPVTFDWVDTSSHPTGYGFLAQDLYAVFPDAVSKGDDDNSLHNRHVPGFQPWMVDYSKLVPVAIAEIKSLRGRVAALESVNKQLSERLTADEKALADVKASVSEKSK